MGDFIVSARKYRPSTFDSVVGQSSITATLKNAIKNKHLAHAYLFCGPRGVGKTTCARIFAKTLNCMDPTTNMEPCNKCESCNAFNQSRSYSIHELDAASNNSVEDIRSLIDQVRIPPQVGNYSIYIIDEVHMLSSQAFNAFLKTLEEPPAHAIFILATTEKHKIIPTILSRCQIFDFNRIKIEDTVGYLEKIARAENITYEPEAFSIIAQKADGAMRDALSIFDQIVSFSNAEITYQNVIENLNILDYEYYFKIVDAALEGNVATNLLIFDEILEKGFDAHNFVIGLGSHFRDLLVCKDVATVKLLEVGASIKEKYQQQATKAPEDFIFDALSVLNQCDISFKTSKHPRLHVELALVKISNLIAKKKTSTPTNPVVKPDPGKPAPPGNERISTVGTGKSAGTVKSENPENNIDTGTKKEGSPTKTNIQYPGQTISIKKAFNKNKQGEHVERDHHISTNEAPERYGNKPIDKKELEKEYREFVQKYKDERPRIYSTLNNQTPDLKDEHILVLKMNNSTQHEEFKNDVKQQLINYLKRKLENGNITIEIEISKTTSKNTLYTDDEKFVYMSKKNPNLNILKQKFNLDFE